MGSASRLTSLALECTAIGGGFHDLLPFSTPMKLKVIVHHDSEGLWGEVPAIPGCVSQGDTMPELMANLREAIEGCLAVEIGETPASAQVIEIAV